MAVSFVPVGYPAVSPYLLAGNPDEVIAFIVEAFGGQLVRQMTTPQGMTMHAEVRVGDSLIMIGGITPGREEMTNSVHVYVPDVDRAYAVAIKRGAKSVSEPTTQFYGDRSAGVVDTSGTTWWIATHVEDVSDEETLRRAAQQKAK